MQRAWYVDGSVTTIEVRAIEPDAEGSRAVTHEDFRGRGIFPQLVRFLAAEARRRGYAILYATPHPGSAPLFIERLKFQPMFHWSRAMRPLAWKHVALLPKPMRGAAWALQPAWELAFPLHGHRLDVRVGEIADPGVAELAEHVRPITECVIDRDESYLRWRFARPGIAYHHVHCRRSDGALVGWAAARYVQQGERKRLHVGDWLAAPGHGHLRGVLAGARDLARELGATELYVAGRCVGGPGPDRRRGFLTRPSQMPVVGLGLEQSVEVFKSWDYREADADMF